MMIGREHKLSNDLQIAAGAIILTTSRSLDDLIKTPINFDDPKAESIIKLARLLANFYIANLEELEQRLTPTKDKE